MENEIDKTLGTLPYINDIKKKEFESKFNEMFNFLELEKFAERIDVLSDILDDHNIRKIFADIFKIYSNFSTIEKNILQYFIHFTDGNILDEKQSNMYKMNKSIPNGWKEYFWFFHHWLIQIDSRAFSDKILFDIKNETLIFRLDEFHNQENHEIIKDLLHSVIAMLESHEKVLKLLLLPRYSKFSNAKIKGEIKGSIENYKNNKSKIEEYINKFSRNNLIFLHGITGNHSKTWKYFTSLVKDDPDLKNITDMPTIEYKSTFIPSKFISIFQILSVVIFVYSFILFLLSEDLSLLIKIIVTVIILFFSFLLFNVFYEFTESFKNKKISDIVETVSFELKAHIKTSYNNHIVCHSMGGLVFIYFLKKHYDNSIAYRINSLTFFSIPFSGSKWVKFYRRFDPLFSDLHPKSEFSAKMEKYLYKSGILLGFKTRYFLGEDDLKVIYDKDKISTFGIENNSHKFAKIDHHNILRPDDFDHIIYKTLKKHLTLEK